MKKTIVAAAVAALVAAPAAFADVSISGQINQEFTTDDGTGDAEQNLNADIVFKVSEDLGNGMKADVVIHTLHDNNAAGDMQETAASASVNNADRYIKISGDFGSVQTGTFEPYIEGAVAALAANDAADAVSIETNLGNATRTEGGIRYVAPAMNGFTVGVEGFVADETSTDNFDTTAIFVQYSNGPLTVRVADEDTATDDIFAAAATYKMGDTSFGVVYSEDDANSQDETYVGVSHAMGANTISAAVIADSTEDTDGDYTLSFKHAMSKNTAVYVAHKSDDSDSSTDMTAFGVQVKF